MSVAISVAARGGRRATWAGCGAIALWAFLALLARAAAAVPPLELAGLSLAVSAALGLVVLAARGRLRELRQPPLAWVHGAGGLFGYHALYFAALALAPAAEANLINYTWPLLVVLLSALLLGMRLRPAHLAGVAVAVAGCALLLGRGAGAGAVISGRAMLGYAAAMGGSLTWALYSILARRLSGVPTGAVAGFCAGASVLALATHAAVEPTVIPSGGAWLAILALGLGPMGSAFFLWEMGMKRGDPRLLGTLAYAAPVGSTLLLCAGGFAPFTPVLLAAALLVAAGGLAAARG